MTEEFEPMEEGFMELPSELDEIEEAKPVVEGRYPVRVNKAVIKTAKNGKKYISLVLGIEDNPDAAPIFEMIWTPDPASDYYKDELRKVKRFKLAFGLEEGGIDVAGLSGLTAELDIDYVKDDFRGEMVNKVRWPRIQ